jgi:hypothetical protein
MNVGIISLNLEEKERKKALISLGKKDLFATVISGHNNINLYYIDRKRKKERKRKLE